MIWLRILVSTVVDLFKFSNVAIRDSYHDDARQNVTFSRHDSLTLSLGIIFR